MIKTVMSPMGRMVKKPLRTGKCKVAGVAPWEIRQRFRPAMTIIN
jgi:hypothetical protein